MLRVAQKRSQRSGYTMFLGFALGGDQTHATMLMRKMSDDGVRTRFAVDADRLFLFVLFVCLSTVVVLLFVLELNKLNNMLLLLSLLLLFASCLARQRCVLLLYRQINDARLCLPKPHRRHRLPNNMQLNSSTFVCLFVCGCFNFVV
jgi:hypothetical protein